MHKYIDTITKICKLQYRQWPLIGSFVIVETIVSWIWASANYYRAEIVEFSPKGKAKVMLVDVGEYREIPCDQLMCFPATGSMKKLTYRHDPQKKKQIWEAYNMPHEEPGLVYRIELDTENRDEEKCLNWLQAHHNENVYVMFTHIDQTPAFGDVQNIRGKIFDKSKCQIPISEDEALLNHRSGNQDIRSIDPKWQEKKETSRFSRMSRSSSQSSISSTHQTIQKPIVKVPPRMSTKSTVSETNTETTEETNRIIPTEKPEPEIAISVAELVLNDSNEGSNETLKEENLEFEYDKVLEDAKNLLEKLYELPSIESVAANNTFDIIVKR